MRAPVRDRATDLARIETQSLNGTLNRRKIGGHERLRFKSNWGRRDGKDFYRLPKTPRPGNG
jgi:hypothetical protein